MKKNIKLIRRVQTIAIIIALISLVAIVGIVGGVENGIAPKTNTLWCLLPTAVMFIAGSFANYLENL